MIRILLHSLVAMVLALAAILVAVQHIDPTPPPLLVHADYQRCVRINNGPLVISKPQIGGTTAISELS